MQESQTRHRSARTCINTCTTSLEAHSDTKTLSRSQAADPASIANLMTDTAHPICDLPTSISPRDIRARSYISSTLCRIFLHASSKLKRLFSICCWGPSWVLADESSVRCPGHVVVKHPFKACAGYSRVALYFDMLAHIGEAIGGRRAFGM